MRAARQVLHHVIQDLVDPQQRISLCLVHLQARPQSFKYVLPLLGSTWNTAVRFSEELSSGSFRDRIGEQLESILPLCWHLQHACNLIQLSNVTVIEIDLARVLASRSVPGAIARGSLRGVAYLMASAHLVARGAGTAGH